MTLKGFIILFRYVALSCMLINLAMLLLIITSSCPASVVDPRTTEATRSHVFALSFFSYFFVIFFFFCARDRRLENYREFVQSNSDIPIDLPILKRPMTITYLHFVFFLPLFMFCCLTIILPIGSCLLTYNILWKCL